MVASWIEEFCGFNLTIFSVFDSSDRDPRSSRGGGGTSNIIVSMESVRCNSGWHRSKSDCHSRTFQINSLSWFPEYPSELDDRNIILNVIGSSLSDPRSSRGGTSNVIVSKESVLCISAVRKLDCQSRMFQINSLSWIGNIILNVSK